MRRDRTAPLGQARQRGRDIAAGLADGAVEDGAVRPDQPADDLVDAPRRGGDLALDRLPAGAAGAQDGQTLGAERRVEPKQRPIAKGPQRADLISVVREQAVVEPAVMLEQGPLGAAVAVGDARGPIPGLAPLALVMSWLCRRRRL